MSYTNTYYPKKPIKSFQDLEVYQKLLAISVAIAKRVKSEKAVAIALDLPVKIATAHSLRFGDQEQAIHILEEIMLACNILIVYLEQYRDLENKEIETEFFEEQIKNILSTRQKILHLQKSWQKFAKEYTQHAQ
ncbi:MAG: hypothetical protein A2632_01240 [Candidatus Pacebacteria bacterium RIFCSPHIGHO2_01_FULL_46_16]|nr:MAG: hypothetical protein A2632_01240 [Candidatus Pacebacteria bacterium RIFCSPHIGHO2_01_FULL_46_16]